MIEQQHSFTPPPELLKQWEDDWFEEREHADVLLVNAYAAGALVGADAELEACCEWLMLNGYGEAASRLNAARRPKPLSLKLEALLGLESLTARLEEAGLPADLTVLYRALEQLPDEISGTH